uniref:Transmembrane protein n=1 Tax=Ceratitis capitata TaxID=7213 RepID=W8AW10_CERCA
MDRAIVMDSHHYVADAEYDAVVVVVVEVVVVPTPPTVAIFLSANAVGVICSCFLANSISKSFGFLPFTIFVAFVFAVAAAAAITVASNTGGNWKIDQLLLLLVLLFLHSSLLLCSIIIAEFFVVLAVAVVVVLAVSAVVVVVMQKSSPSTALTLCVIADCTAMVLSSEFTPAKRCVIVVLVGNFSFICVSHPQALSACCFRQRFSPHFSTCFCASSTSVRCSAAANDIVGGGGGGGGGGGEVHFKKRRIGVGRGGGCCGLSQIVVHCSEKKVVCVVVCRSLSHFKLNEIIFVFAFAFAF